MENLNFEEADHEFRSRRQVEPCPIIRDRLGIPIKNFELLREHPADDFLREQTRLNLIDLHQFLTTRN